MCHLAPYEKSKSLGFGESIVARLKLKGIDKRALLGVKYWQIDLTQENSLDSNITRIDRLIALS
jgi:hypothetical protein